MSILLNDEKKLLVQGITGKEGQFHSRLMRESGINIVAGVTPGRGGEWTLDDEVPVFDTVKAACEATGANASVIFVPAPSATDAVLESIDQKLELIVCITEGIPQQDMLLIRRLIRATDIRFIGPNSPGILCPKFGKVGIIPANIVVDGPVGVVSRSGTLTYEVLSALSENNIGVSTCLGIGGDPLVGLNFIDVLKLFEADPHTEKIIMIGEIGGRGEEMAADYVALNMSKRVVGMIAGQAAPAGRRMGHAGAIIESGSGSAESKIKALKNAGVAIAASPAEIPGILNAK